MADSAGKTDLEEIHRHALQRADEAWVFERDNIREGREDQRFYAGDQWDEAAKRARGTDRPMLTVNRMGTFVRQVTGDLRQNTPAIKVLPARGPASQDKADILTGIIRSIEAESDAAACYVKAASNAAQAGQGAFRILTEYCNDKSFDLDIRIRQIADPFGVLVDPLAQMPDKSDAAYVFVFERMSKEAFKAKYPDASTDDVEIVSDAKGVGHFQWITSDSVRIAEYWCRETTTTKLHELEDGTITDRLPWSPKGVKVKPVRSREVETVSIVSYMLSGKVVLSGPHAWAGKYIPVCFVPGEEVTIDGATLRKGMIRDAKDPQRLVNYARTTEAESVALQPKAPFVATVKQIAGYEPIWKSAGTVNHPWLPYNADPALGPTQAPQRAQPPVMSTGLQNLNAQAGQDMHDVFGIYPASLGAKSNETSGVAIRARQHEGDTGSNYVIDNTRRAIAFAGRILCDLIPKIYDGARIVRILKEDGSHELETINGPRMDQKTGQPLPQIDLTVGEYDVEVSTGPSYLTRQQEMAETIVELSRNMPQVAQVAGDLLVKALNFPGGDEIAKRLERTIPPSIREDDAPPPEPNPKDVADARESMASANLKDAQASKALLEADALAMQLGAMPAQLQALTQMVTSLMQGGGQPQQQEAPQPGPGPMPMAPPGGPPPQGPQPMEGGEGEIVDLEPIEGAPA